MGWKNKNPGPEGPALISPQGWSVEFTLEPGWNNGISKIRILRSGKMEYWELNTDEDLTLNSD
jgi:hypothetical protein